jgi:tetratricopeptide (TPR) repeat protein
MTNAPSLDKTALICRPNQLREAAIVLSCIGSSGTTLLSVLESPPLSRREYDNVYEAYTEARQESMKNVVGLQYLGTEKDAAEIRAAIKRHHELHSQLTAPRSWLTHGRRWSELLTALHYERAVILFPPSADDLTLWPNVKARNEWVAESAATVEELKDRSLLPAGIKIITFLARGGPDVRGLESTNYTYESVDELSKLAWRVLRNGAEAGIPESADSCDVGSILMGLLNALERNVPLQISNPAARAGTQSSQRAGPDKAGCVLVETTDNASSLAGVIYAYHKGLSLFVCDPPDEKRIKSAIEAFQISQQQSKWASRLVSSHIDEVRTAPDLLPDEKAAILKAATSIVEDVPAPEEIKAVSLTDLFRRYILGDWRREAIQNIEQAVSAHLRSETVSEIGERSITVFTAGVPYNFVRVAGYDWSCKAIGHVAFDAPLVVATDLLLSQRSSPTATYAAIFDPGFFRTSETRDVIASMDGHSAHCLVFSKAASGLHGLKLAAALPLELVFFNTHGSDDSIVLGDLPVKNEMLVQWVEFPSTPIIFNNSCLSWTGVGREFVRVGARGYIGTLWPVNAETAAVLAAKAMKEMVDGTPIAMAIRRVPLDEETRMAYVYAGLADSRILPRGNESEERKQYIVDAAECFLDALLSHGPALAKDHDPSLLRFAYSELESFFSRSELKDVKPPLLYRLRVKQLLVLASNLLQFGVSKEDALVVASHCFTLHELCRSLDTDAPDERAILFDARAQIRRQAGDISGAIQDLEASAKAPPIDGHDDLIARLNIANLLKMVGYWSQANEIAAEAKREAGERGNDEARMRLAGLLGQLERRKGDFDAALAHAKEGLALSVKLQNRTEQAEFTLDIARVHLQRLESEAAVSSAKEGGDIARSIMDEDRVLHSQGLLSQAYRQKKEWVLARESAEHGLMMAVARNDVFEQAGFLRDLGSVSEGEGNLALAIERYRRSMILTARSGRIEGLRFYARIASLALQTGDWAQISSVLDEQLVAHAILPSELRNELIVKLIEILRRAVYIGPLKDVLSRLAAIAQRCETMLNTTPQDPGLDWRLAALTAVMLIQWLKGSPIAMEIAREIDEKRTDGGFHWREFISGSPPFAQDPHDR